MRPRKEPLRCSEDVLAAQLEDPEVRSEWTRLAPARAVALALVGYRIDHGLTQTALARILGMSQPAVARLEGGDHVPSLETMVRLADALDIQFLVGIKPSGKRASWSSQEAERAQVVERVTTTSGSELMVAAGRSAA